MLESRSEDALVLLVKLVKSTVTTVETVETVETAETVETKETVLTEDLKKKQSLTYSLTDSLKARDASASKKQTKHWWRRQKLRWVLAVDQTGLQNLPMLKQIVLVLLERVSNMYHASLFNK